MSESPKLADWELFVIANGWQADAGDLSAVVGQPVEVILRLRATGVCARLEKEKDFAELFVLWHGREPGEDDWPAPRKVGAHGAYEWQPPEVALLASLVGQISQAEITEVLSARLREKTGDLTAERTKNAIQVRTNKIGLQTTDVVGGLTVAEAAREISSYPMVYQAIEKGDLPTHRIGRLHVISHSAWAEWKSNRTFPPAEFIQLSSIREALGIKSDKLSEYARMGLIPTSLRCNPYGSKGKSTRFGTWWISKETAEQLLSDRRAGHQMPWHGKYTDNLRTTFRTWEKRKHPESCKTCAEIWGEQGVPQNFDEYSVRYPDLAHGAKRHLTRPWSPGITLAEVATQAGKTIEEVRRAIENGALAATTEADGVHVSRTDATRWISRKCPNGESVRSWITLEVACATYFFTSRELRKFIDAGDLKVRIGLDGSVSGDECVLRHQCGQLREKIGFTEEQAARRLGVSVERFRRLVDGVDWRGAEKIPLATVQAVRKRLDSRHGYTIEEAAAALGQSDGWVKEQIEKGATRVSRAKWDRRRIYITEPMLQRLRDVLGRSAPAEKLSVEWLLLSEAAMEAGVSLATLNDWGATGELAFREHKGVRHYHRQAVRAQARKYWQTVRFHRAAPPVWLSAEACQ